MDAFLQALRSDPRLAAAILFGSAVRGRLRADSDVDLAILAMDTDAQARLETDLLATLGAYGRVARRDVHLVDLERADPALRRSIFEHGRVLFDRSGGRLRALEVRTLIEYFDGEYMRRIIDEGHRRRLEQALG